MRLGGWKSQSMVAHYQRQAVTDEMREAVDQLQRFREEERPSLGPVGE